MAVKSNPKALNPEEIYNYIELKPFDIEKQVIYANLANLIYNARANKYSSRLALQRYFAQLINTAKGKIINIGCGDDSAQLSDFENVINVDMDIYNHRNFIKADAYNLHMFSDDYFDLAILGDILEHAYEPVDMIKEAGRIAKNVILTIFEDWVLPEDGRNADYAIDMKIKDFEKLGHKTCYENMIAQDTIKDKIIAVDEETWKYRLPSIWQFTDNMLKDIFNKTGMQTEVMIKFLEYKGDDHAFNNWFVLLVK